jgi:hypothetical protein
MVAPRSGELNDAIEHKEAMRYTRLSKTAGAQAMTARHPSSEHPEATPWP